MPAQDSKILKELHGIECGLAKAGHIVGNGFRMTPPTVDADFTIGAPAANSRAIQIQLKHKDGSAIEKRQTVTAYLFADANGDAFAATGGSVGIAIGTNGALLTEVAKKKFTLISEDNGLIDLTFGDTAHEVCYLGLELPTGRLIISSALTI